MWLINNNAGGIKEGNEYKVYENKVQGYKHLETLIKGYIDHYGNDIKSMRDRYCQCGEEDYIKFMEILEQERKLLDEKFQK